MINVTKKKGINEQTKEKKKVKKNKQNNNKIEKKINNRLINIQKEINENNGFFFIYSSLSGSFQFEA